MGSYRYHYTREEQETVIRWDQTPDDAWIWTCDPVLIRRLAAKGVEPVRIERTPDGGEFGRAYRVPKRWIRVSPPRAVTPARRQQLAAARARLLANSTPKAL